MSNKVKIYCENEPSVRQIENVMDPSQELWLVEIDSSMDFSKPTKRPEKKAAETTAPNGAIIKVDKEKLKKARRKKGLNQTQAAKKLKISPSTISRAETSGTGSDELMANICSLYGISLQSVLL